MALVKKQRLWGVLSALLLYPLFVFAQTNPQQTTGPHIEVALVAENTVVVPGSKLQLGILLQPEEGWHTYWRNPGDSGEPPRVSWQADADVKFGEIQWPVPKPIPVAHLVNYGYEGENLLIVDVDIPATLATSSITFTGDISWLVCKEDCIPGWATLSIKLPVSSERSASKWQARFDNTRAMLPTWATESFYFETSEQHISISLPKDLIQGFNDDVGLLPFRDDVIQHNASQVRVVSDETVIFTIPKSDYFQASEDDLQWLLTDGSNGVYFDASSNLMGQKSNLVTMTGVLFYFALAFLGGIILNLMPCVLPVLSLKALSLHNDVKSLPQWGYPLGVLLSFWVFAAIIIALRATGQSVGWGFHLQSPWMIALLAFLFVYIALMLLDSTPLGAGLANVGNQLTQGQGFRQQFFTGVLAVVVASPCTAPFMAAAMGFAFISDYWVTLVIFTGLALGFALPLSAISFIPTCRNWLPKPGAWMETFRQFLVFPILATVAWLVWVYRAQTDHALQLFLLLSLLTFALFVWLASKLSSKKRVVCSLVAAIIVAVVIFYPIQTNGDATIAQGQSFSPQLLNKLRNEGKTVLVNMTADWCITCKVNEQLVFQRSEVLDALQESNVSYLVGDWTNRNKEILNYLTYYERSGVPLYVVYHGQSPGQVLPQILTTDIVISALTTQSEAVK